MNPLALSAKQAEDIYEGVLTGMISFKIAEIIKPLVEAALRGDIKSKGYSEDIKDISDDEFYPV